MQQQAKKKNALQWILDILRGAVIGVSNDIPGVSGGTMAVSMGIYDRIIFDVNNFRKEKKKNLMDLLPILIGVLVGIFGFARVLKPLIGDEGQVPPPPTLLPTICVFIILILCGLPTIWKKIDLKKASWKGGLLFIAFFALVVTLPLFQAGSSKEIDHSFGSMILLVLLGALASATMVIPGVSGSMILLILGYYHSIINALHKFDMFILLPYALGLVLGIVFIAKLLNFLLKKYTSLTFSAILGLVVGSPFALLYQNSICFGNDETAKRLSFIIIICLYLVCFLVFAFWRLFQKAGEPGWKCLIPIYNLYIYWKIGWKVSRFWIWFFSTAIGSIIIIILTLTLKENSIIPVIVVSVLWGIYAFYLQIRMSIVMAHRFKKSAAFGIFLLFLLPIGNLILGYGKADYDKTRDAG